ncbi:MAG: hypothetical protein KTR33_13980 [Gammaproteobacteria bacterium]|nr:hypothetical protein [Gammaproteobacteria bacterium]
MKLLSPRLWGAVSCTIAIVLATGCASTVISPISEADKDPNGTYDGSWTGNVLKSPATQYGPGNWTFNCNGKPWDFGFSVAKSVASIDYQKTKHFAYVDKDGRFRFEVPMNNDTKASGTSDASIQRGSRTMIINGSLKANTGRITFGIEQFANQGCTAKIAFKQ